MSGPRVLQHRGGHSCVDELNTTRHGLLGPSTTVGIAMRVDPADLIGPAEVAEIIGITNPGGVSVYRHRYDDFPEPIVEKGRCLLWLRPDVERWATTRSYG